MEAEKHFITPKPGPSNVRAWAKVMDGWTHDGLTTHTKIILEFRLGCIVHIIILGYMKMSETECNTHIYI